jgi:cytochrome c-type biogenesis protein CcmH
MVESLPPAAEYRARPPRGPRSAAPSRPASAWTDRRAVASRDRAACKARLAWSGPALRQLLAWLLMLFALACAAKDAPPDPIDNAAVEARMLRITEELRCLVCQNETIAGSNASLAEDLRTQVRDMIRKGQTDEQILKYMTDRYGDFVLYRPPLKATTFLLWFGPGVLLVGGLAVLYFVLRRRTRMSDDRFEPDELDAAEEGAPR